MTNPNTESEQNIPLDYDSALSDFRELVHLYRYDMNEYYAFLTTSKYIPQSLPPSEYIAKLMDAAESAVKLSHWPIFCRRAAIVAKEMGVDLKPT